jgi:hypothetical protein
MIIERAEEILDAIRAVARSHQVTLPEEQWVQVGQPVISCSSVVVGVLNMSPSTDSETMMTASGNMCSPIRNSSFIAAISRDGDASNHDGSNYLYGLAELSKAGEEDGQILWEAITSMLSPALAGTAGVIVNYEFEGNMLATSVTFTTGI